MLLDRHRVARLVELSALERTLKGPERLLRENDVTVLVKAAYDDATDEARAAFMARVQSMPTSAWPWSAVQATAPRGGGGSGAGGSSIGSVSTAPKPGTPTTPAALILIRGQAESADVDPGNRLPDRGTPEAIEWEPLQKALDAWDTQTILKSIGAQGWVSMIGTTSGATSGAPAGSTSGAPAGSTSGAPAGSTSGAPAGSTSGAPAGAGGTPAGTTSSTNGTSGKAPSGLGGGESDLPAPQPSPTTTVLSWKHPAVLAAGAVLVVAGGVALHTLSQDRRRSRLEEALGRQEEIP